MSPVLHATVLSLRRKAEPIAPETTLAKAAARIAGESYAALLCLPVVDGRGRPVGVISRQRINELFLALLGREVHGDKPVSRFMNTAPLAVEHHLSIEDAAAAIGGALSAPVTEDYLITHDGRYLGVGSVADLLGALHKRLAAQVEFTALAYRKLQLSQAGLAAGTGTASLGQALANLAQTVSGPVEALREKVVQLEAAFASLEETHTARRDGNPFDEARTLIGDTLLGVEQLRERLAGLPEGFGRS